MSDTLRDPRLLTAAAIAQAYHGKPVSDAYLLGAATGGAVWLKCADAALRVRGIRS